MKKTTLALMVILLAGCGYDYGDRTGCGDTP